MLSMKAYLKCHFPGTQICLLHCQVLSKHFDSSKKKMAVNSNPICRECPKILFRS